MPLYLLSVCYPADAQQPDPAAMEKIMTDLGRWRADLVERGAWVFGGGLHDPSTATTVVEQDGRAVLTDGPFIEAKEQIGGITIIDVADLDEAIEVARAQSRAVTTPIEVRPFVPDGSN